MRAPARGRRYDAAELAARLHEVSTGMAIGIALLKGSSNEEAAVNAGPIRALLETSLTDLRRMTAAIAEGAARSSADTSVPDCLSAEARRLRLKLDLEVAGDERWLTLDQEQLLELVGRESLRNVRQHAGTDACRITIDLANCPFEMRVRDWGAGFQRGERPGHGLSLLQRLASEAGWTISVASQPGLGTEIALTGPACPFNSTERHVMARSEPGPRSEDGQRTPEDGQCAERDGQVSAAPSRLVRQMKTASR